MNWEAIGAVGEIIGAAGVIITLLYLASQLQQNTRALQVTSNDSTTQVGNDIRAVIASDPVLTEVWYRGLRDPDGLDEIESERFRLLMSNVLWALWNAWRQSQLGGLESWTAQKHILNRLLALPGGRRFWVGDRGELDPDFVAEVDRMIGGGTA